MTKPRPAQCNCGDPVCDVTPVAGVRSVDHEDNCDDCGRPMPFTGAQVCLSCEEYERSRETCIVCGGRKVFLDDETCSDACDARLAEWPEP